MNDPNRRLNAVETNLPRDEEPRKVESDKAHETPRSSEWPVFTAIRQALSARSLLESQFLRTWAKKESPRSWTIIEMPLEPVLRSFRMQKPRKTFKNFAKKSKKQRKILLISSMKMKINSTSRWRVRLSRQNELYRRASVNQWPENKASEERDGTVIWASQKSVSVILRLRACQVLIKRCSLHQLLLRTRPRDTWIRQNFTGQKVLELWNFTLRPMSQYSPLLTQKGQMLTSLS